MRTLVLATLLVLACGLSAFADPLVYAQNPDYNGAYSSQNDTNGFGNFATAYDDFTLSATTNITEIQWIGSYFNPPAQGTITGFTVGFYDNNGTLPGNLLASGSGPGNFNETFIGFDNAGDPTFLYTGFLSGFPAFQAGHTYWMSLVPDLGFPPQWGWETSYQGNGYSAQTFFGSTYNNPSDLSFALYGNTTSSTPEPGTLVMLATGIVGLAGTIRRKLF